MPRTLIDLNTIVMAILSREMDAPGLFSFKCRAVEIAGEEPLAWTLDGEFGGTPTKSNIEIIKNAVKYVANRKTLPQR
jgi:diacylglycerol kinase family enzyme